MLESALAVNGGTFRYFLPELRAHSSNDYPMPLSAATTLEQMIHSECVLIMPTL